MFYYKTCLPKALIAGISITLTLMVSFHVAARETGTPTVEVFTDSSFLAFDKGEGLSLYVIDRIDQLQQALSKELPKDPDKAKQEVLRRFHVMDANLSRQLENAATGLTKAMTYGIDRYPAIVFDGKTVIYGVTDLDVANDHYRRWQGEVND